MLAITRHRVPWPGLTAPVRIAQLTDVHVGPSTPFSLVREAVRVAAAEGDVVVFTGDTVNLLPFGARRFARLLRGIPKPCVAVLGNHDHVAGARRISAWFADAGVTVLRNQHHTVGDLHIVGVDDGYTRHADPVRAFAGLPEPDRRGALVLTHHPPDADAIAALGGRIILAGHTHGGQVRLPGTRTLAEWWSGDAYVHGWYDVGPARLYVCAGLGHAPFRVGVPPEVAVFTLEPG